jgi:hypothetical protein
LVFVAPNAVKRLKIMKPRCFPNLKGMNLTAHPI